MSASLVVQTSFIGDVILTTPLIAELARSGPVDVVTTVAGASVLANNPDVHSVLVYDKRGGDRGVGGFVKTVIRARRLSDAAWGVDVPRQTYGSATVWRGTSTPHAAAQPPECGVAPGLTESVGGGRWGEAPHDRCGAVGRAGPPPTDLRRAYLAQGSTRSAGLVLAAGYEERVGFNTSAGKWLYTQQIEYRDDWHHARRLLSLANVERATAADGTMLQPRVYPGVQEVVAVDGLLQGRERPVVAIAPGSVWATKRWPYYAALCERLVADFDVAVIGTHGDAAELGAWMQDARVIDTTGKLSLLGSAEMIRRARAVVTNDSAPQHLASAVGTPTVVVFGPTVPEFGFGPLAPVAEVVGNVGLECRPCDRHGPQRCPLGHWRCMRDVTVELVYEKVVRVLQQSGVA